MAKQDNEEKGKGGLMGALGKAPGAAAALARKAANAYGVAGTYAASVGGNVNPVIPAFMIARERWDRHQRGEGIKERTAADPNYNPEADPTLHKVRPAFGSTAVSDAMADLAFSPIETTKKMLTRLTGRDSAEEPTELPQTVSDADLGISEPGANMYADLGSEAVTEEPGANMYEDLEGSDDSGPVDYSLTNGSSTDTMGQNIGVGEKRDVHGFPTDYEGDYDNAEKEWEALRSHWDDMVHGGEGNIKRDSPEGQALDARLNYLWDKIDEANLRKIRAEKAEKAEEQTYDTDTRQYDQYGFPSEYVAPSGRGMGGKWENAKDELEGHRNRTTGEIVGLSPDRQKYLEDLIKDAEKRKADSDSDTPGGGQTSTGGSTRTTAYRPGYDRTNNRGITGALEISAIPHARSQELQNGRIVLQGRSYDVVGNTGDKFLVPSPDQPDYSRIS